VQRIANAPHLPASGGREKCIWAEARRAEDVPIIRKRSTNSVRHFLSSHPPSSTCRNNGGGLCVPVKVNAGSTFHSLEKESRMAFIYCEQATRMKHEARLICWNIIARPEKRQKSRRWIFLPWKICTSLKRATAYRVYYWIFQQTRTTPDGVWGLKCALCLVPPFSLNETRESMLCRPLLPVGSCSLLQNAQILKTFWVAFNWQA
jgi:hypothetical protein